MSEFINNQSMRKEAVKNIIRQLHDGKSVSEVKAEFASILEHIGAGEITQVEQMLIDEGLPVSEVQRLCDVHTAVFRETLDKQESPESIPGHPVHTFNAENRIAGRALDALKEAIHQYKADPSSAALDNIRLRLAKLKEYDKHYLRKENLLFPYLEKYNFSGPSKVMWGVQDEIRAKWKALSDLVSSDTHIGEQGFYDQIEALLTPLETAIQEMFYKEAKILLPAALERLSNDDWLDIRSQEDEIGYSYVRPGKDWPPSLHPSLVQTVAESLTFQNSTAPITENSVIYLRSGTLSPEQINLLLTHLPVDVTFIDENDTVCYFSDTPSRIFQRSPAIIGRKVQNCHPPQSLQRVQQIIDDFRSGARSEAEFWIQMQGKFIHIRYFALHDENGSYRGVIEVSQDISQVRTLEGEKRL